MIKKNPIEKKYAYLLELYKKNRLVLSRLYKRYLNLKRSYLNLRRNSNKTVKDLSEKIIEGKYQMIFNARKELVSISDEFLDEIEMTRTEFAQSFYVDTLFRNYLPGINKQVADVAIAPFHFPVMIKNYYMENQHIHPYIHFRLSGSLKYIKEKKNFFYFITIEDISSEVELNYIQNTDSVIKSLSISNLYLQNAMKKIEVHKIMLIFLICSLIEEYNRETSEHLRRIQDITDILSAECLRSGLIDVTEYDKGEYIRDINYTSVLHDIGKMGVPSYLLSKKAKLTADERKVISTHTVIGANYIKRIIDFLKEDPDYSTYVDFLMIPYQIILYHHERWDGKGYPEGLSGKNIPIPARIVSIADTYDAIRANRAYNIPRTHEEAVAIIKSESGKQFDPEIIEAFERVSDLFETIEY